MSSTPSCCRAWGGSPDDKKGPAEREGREGGGGRGRGLQGRGEMQSEKTLSWGGGPGCSTDKLCCRGGRALSGPIGVYRGFWRERETRACPGTVQLVTIHLPRCTPRSRGG